MKKIIYIMYFCFLFILLGCNKINNSQNGKNEYTIYFISNDVLVHQLNSKGMEYINIPNNLEQEGYELVYWYLEDGSIFTSDSLLNKKLEKNIIVKAKWEKIINSIKYIVDEDVINDNPLSYNKNGEDIILNTPIKEGHSFKGWYTDSNFKNIINKIDVSEAKDYTLYAKWEKNIYTIEYIVNDTSIKTEEYSYKDEINLYEYNDLNWYYYLEDEKILFNEKVMPSKNLVLYGFEPTTFEISFNTNGGEYLSSIIYEEGTYIYLPIIDNENSNYIFDGWYYNEKLITYGDEMIILNYTSDITLVAKWKEIYRIDFNTLTSYSISSVDNNSEILIDFRNCNNNLENKNIIIKDSINKLVLRGNPGIEYFNFSINVSSRSNNLNIVFDNFSYKSNQTTALYAKSSSKDFSLYLDIIGISGIKADNGKNGNSGNSYNRNEDVNSSNNGGFGDYGSDGYDAIETNNLIINCHKGSLFSIYAGNGGDGGHGGNGEGSNGPGKSTAGYGGPGGSGGMGGDAIIVDNYLKFEGLGTINIYAGNGGIGGNGGHGGNATVNYSTDDPDHGGAGGEGGRGGHGGVGIYYRDYTDLIVDLNTVVTVYAGIGGTGGHGGNGGDTVSTLFYKSGNPGTAGTFGSGGSFGLITNQVDDIYIEGLLLITKVEGRNGSNGLNGEKGEIN